MKSSTAPFFTKTSTPGRTLLDSAPLRSVVHDLCGSTCEREGSFGAEGADVNFEHFGIYYDDISRIDDSWKFTHRLVVSIYLGSGAMAGEVVAERATLLHPPAP